MIGELCENAFVRHSKADCVLYDKVDCDKTIGTREMGNGDTIMDIEKLTKTNETFEVESISVREGCALTVYTGKNIIILKYTSRLIESYNCRIMRNRFPYILGNKLDGMGNTYSAYRQNLHVSFQNELQDVEKVFHDNVKSAECTCNLGNFYLYVLTVP